MDKTSAPTATKKCVHFVAISVTGMESSGNAAPSGSAHTRLNVAPLSPAASTVSSTTHDSALGASPISLSSSPSPIASTASSSQAHPHQLHHQHSPHGDSQPGGQTLSPAATTVLIRIGFAVIKKHIAGAVVPPIRSEANVIDILLEDFPHYLNQLAKKFGDEKFKCSANEISGQTNGTDVYVIASADDIRQQLYPLFTAAVSDVPTIRKSNDNSGSDSDNSNAGRRYMPSLFHRFIPFVDCNTLTPDIPSTVSSDFTSQQLDALIKFISEESVDDLIARVEQINQFYVPAVCCDTNVDSSLIVRARGLPWQASDLEIGLFFSGLNISPGGIVLCLSAEGRRNGEALVRFESATQRELALRRNRKFLHGRYIEVYRATGDEFVRVAVGADAEVVRFVSREAAMIVRMRGLPFQTTEQQIRDFFAPSSFDEDGSAAASATVDSGIVEPGGILFVNRADGRPSGDAFVLFASEAAGRQALSKHKHRIGSRYVELFRTTQAEVQQLFNRTLRSPQQHQHHLLQQQQQQALQQQQYGTMAPRRDCVRLRGLPYEAQVQQVVEFLGAHARNVVFQGVHMIYNNQGHPSGEAFIQMNSEQAAAVAAQTMHNKYMELGKKKRYIEVFQCSPEDMNILLNAPAFPTAATAPVTHGSTTGHNILPTTLSAPAGALPPNIIHMGIVSNSFMPFGASPQAPIFRATPMSGFAPLLTPHAASGQTSAGANQSQQQPQPATGVSLPNSIVYNGGTATLINTTSSANGQSAVTAANFCFPTLTTTIPPPFGAPANTAPLPGMMTVDHFQQNGQFLQIPFFHLDATGSMTAMQTAALINLQQQQQQLLGKAQFFPLTTGNGLPTALGQFQWNGNVASTLTYPMQLVAGGSNTTPIVNDGSALKIDANNNSNGNTGQLDMQVTTAGMGIPHKAPFTLIHT